MHWSSGMSLVPFPHGFCEHLVVDLVKDPMRQASLTRSTTHKIEVIEATVPLSLASEGPRGQPYG